MRIIVIGYGRVGTYLVRRLLEAGHNVTIIDKNRAVMERDARHLRARLVIGDATDPVLLREAGAEKADVVFALTRNENSNLMAAQVAKAVFNVPRVMAIVYDSEREQSFHTAGIETFPISLAGAEFLALKLRGEAPARMSEAQERIEDILDARPKPPAAPVKAAQPGQPQYIIIVGGGKVGYYLARMLLGKGHEVAVIENDPEVYRLVSNQLDCPTIHGDGSMTSILERAGANRCTVFVAVTNQDHNNLIACQVAKFNFGIPRTVARVKNPKNEAVLQKLGVDVTVSSTALISQIIESELPATRIRTLLNLKVGNLEILEFALDTFSPVVGRALRDLTFPPNSSVVAVLRRDQPLVPRGDTVFEDQDKLLVLAQLSSEAEIRRMFVG